MDKYLFWWHLPLAGVLVVAWLAVGSYLLRASLTKLTQQRRVPLGRCVLATLLAGGAGAFGGAVFYMLINSIGQHLDLKLHWLAIPLAVVVMLITAFIVLYSMYQLSVKDTFRISLRPLIGVLIIFAVIGTPAAIVTRSQGLTQYYQEITVNKLEVIRASIHNYQRRFLHPPATLADLVEKGYLDAETLAQPLSDQANGFLYLPHTNGDPNQATPTRIVACSIGHKPSMGRAALLANDHCRWVSASEIQDYLAEPHNADFAAKLKAAGDN